MRDTTFSRRDMLWAAGAFTAGAAFAKPSKAAESPIAAAGRSGGSTQPTSWVEAAMPEVTHRMIETNGIRLHIAEQGEGPLVILCHGFPECWYSWRHQLGALATKSRSPTMYSAGTVTRPPLKAAMSSQPRSILRHHPRGPRNPLRVNAST